MKIEMKRSDGYVYEGSISVPPLLNVTGDTYVISFSDTDFDLKLLDQGFILDTKVPLFGKFHICYASVLFVQMYEFRLLNHIHIHMPNCQIIYKYTGDFTHRDSIEKKVHSLNERLMNSKI